MHCFAENFRPYHESIAKITSVDAGGKGVNISRALTSNGVDNKAVVVVGDENGTQFCSALEKEGLCVLPVWTTGRIRENITLHEKENPETRISFDGFSCDSSVLDSAAQKIGEIDENTVIAFTGSICKGVCTKDVLSLLSSFKDKGAKIIIDSRSVTLSELIEFSPFLVKPNKDEAEGYTDKPINSLQDAAEVANEMRKSGIENVMLTLGGDGAILACESGTYYAKTPKIEAVSTIGAGDSTIAGFIAAIAQGKDCESTLLQAAAYGTAACLLEGTRPPLAADIQKIKDMTEIKKLSV